MIKPHAICKYSLVILQLVLLSCAFTYKVNAQTFINRTYLENKPTMLFGSIFIDDSNYIVTGVTSYTPNPNIPKGIIAKISLHGQMNQITEFVDSNTAAYGVFTNALIKDSKGRYVFTGLSYSSQAFLLFGFANATLDTITVLRHYRPATFTYHGYALVELDNHFYVGGGRTDSIAMGNANATLVKLDSDGNRMFEVKYGTSQIEFCKSIISLSNGNLLMGAVRHDLNQTNEKANTWLIEVDTGGNIVRQWFDNDDSTYAAEGLTQTQDGGFVYGALRKGYQTINNVFCYSSIVKLDSNFNMQWEYRDYNISGYSGIFDIEELPDGSIIACGNRTDDDNDFLSGWIIKLSPTGEVIWNRLYQGLTVLHAFNFLSDIDVLTDGSLVAVGQCQNPNGAPVQVGWLLKVDSNGCEIQNCVVGIEDVDRSQSFKVYPNPATDRLIVEIPELNQASKIYISSITGESIAIVDMPIGATSVEVNTANFAAGVYLAKVDAAIKKFIIAR